MMFAIYKKVQINSITRQNDFQNRQNFLKKSKNYLLNAAALKALKALRLSEGTFRSIV